MAQAWKKKNLQFATSAHINHYYYLYGTR